MDDTSEPRRKMPRKTRHIQDEVLNESAADAVDGGPLDSGTDATAGDLEQVKQSGDTAPLRRGASASASQRSPTEQTARRRPAADAAAASAGHAVPGEARVPAMRQPTGHTKAAKPDARPAEARAGESPLPAPSGAGGEDNAPDAASRSTAPTEQEGRKQPRLWAHAALQASFLDNRINSQEWDTWGFRLVPDVKKSLETRLVDDKRSADNRRLAQGHYINAAMLHLPRCVEEQLQMIREFLMARSGYTDPGRPSNYRVSHEVWKVARDLDMEITAAAKRGLVVFLFSAAVESFLDALESEGALKRPEIFRKMQ